MTIKRRLEELEGKIKGDDRTDEEREAEREMIEKAEKKAAERLKKIRLWQGDQEAAGQANPLP